MPRAAHTPRRIADYLRAHGPAHVYQIAADTGIHVATVRRAIQHARQAGQAHVSGHQPLGRRQPAKIWSHGPGADITYQPKPRDTRHQGHWTTSPTARRLCARLASGGPATVKALSIDCHCSEHVARGHLSAMHKAARIRIHAWLRATGVGGNYSIVWALGAAPDAPRPTATSKAQNYRAWRLRTIARYGPEIASRMFRSRRNGGADRIVLDGRVVYERGRRTAAKGAA